MYYTSYIHLYYIYIGKEKEGIPVEYLSEMDILIEIPQFGVTRSLNVHVSCALFIWEMTRRHIERGNLSN